MNLSLDRLIYEIEEEKSSGVELKILGDNLSGFTLSEIEAECSGLSVEVFSFKRTDDDHSVGRSGKLVDVYLHTFLPPEKTSLINCFLHIFDYVRGYQISFPFYFVHEIAENHWMFGEKQTESLHFTGYTFWEVIDSFDSQYGLSLESPEIYDDETTGVGVAFQVLTPGMIEFEHKVSTEEGFDFLHFYINGDLISSWSGENDWRKASFFLGKGHYYLQWNYEKDSLFSGGRDRVWLDNIRLPDSFLVMDPLDDDVVYKLGGAKRNEYDITHVVVLVQTIIKRGSYKSTLDLNEDQVLDLLDVVELVRAIVY